MYAVVAFSVLLAVASAGKEAVNQEPKKCCSAPYYTFDSNVVSTGLKDGALLTELAAMPGAYDSIAKKIGLKYTVHISNGTVEGFRVIADYDEGKSYIIYKVGEEAKCDIYDLTSGFPYNCVPEDSKYISTVSIGDRALYGVNWYQIDTSTPTEETHNVYTVQDEGCVDLSAYSRTFHPETGDEVRIQQVTFSNFNLGICDPDKYFKVPEECKAGKAVQDMPKRFTELRGPGGKRLFQ